MEKREVPIKNYIILGILILVTVFLTFRLAEIYRSKTEYFKNKSLLSGILYEVKSEELDNYLLENPNVVIFIVDGNAENNQEMESVVKDIVLENALTHDVMVMDATINSKEVNSKLANLLSKDLKEYEDNLISKTNLLVIREGKIEDILAPKTGDKETIMNFLIKNGVM